MQATKPRRRHRTRMLFAGAMMAATTITGALAVDPAPVEAQGCADSPGNYCVLICTRGLPCGATKHRYGGWSPSVYYY